MDNMWFAEDREAARQDKSVTLEVLQKESKEALKNSTLFQRRLDKILDILIDRTDTDDEDFSKPGWQRQHIANISRRKALRDIKRLIQL